MLKSTQEKCPQKSEGRKDDALRRKMASLGQLTLNPVLPITH